MMEGSLVGSDEKRIKGWRLTGGCPAGSSWSSTRPQIFADACRSTARSSGVAGD
jgi:hypothetical protein